MNISEESVLSQKPENTLAIGLFASPIGEIYVASGNKGLKVTPFYKGRGTHPEDGSGGIKELCVGGDKAGFIAGLKRKYGAEIVEKDSGFARLFRLLDSYFKGKEVSFDLKIDPEGTGFEIKVWHALSRIPYGETKTYGDVAREIGCAKGARAVGGACAKNPLPIIVPCHRVVGANGIGGYSAGGAGTKEFLLRLEGAPAPLSQPKLHSQ